MALKPTIYKFRITLTDLNRDYYANPQLTVALHPSETPERMMARIVAYCLNATPELMFTKGLSSIDEPDIWHKSLDDLIETWIEVGEPDPERVKKACRQADKVFIYSFNAKTDIWWQQNQPKLNLTKAQVYRIQPDGIIELAASCSRTMDLSVMITGDTIYISSDNGNFEITIEQLKE